MPTATLGEQTSRGRIFGIPDPLLFTSISCPGPSTSPSCWPKNISIVVKSSLSLPPSLLPTFLPSLLLSIPSPHLPLFLFLPSLSFFSPSFFFFLYVYMYHEAISLLSLISFLSLGDFQHCRRVIQACDSQHPASGDRKIKSSRSSTAATHTA